MSGYIGTQPVPQATQTRDAFTCTAGQTSFATSGYTPSFLDVYLNGIKLAAADYTASNGSDVVLASGAALNDILEVVAYTSFEVVTDTVTNAGTVLNLDRTGSDGTILDLKKDGSTVGSIGSSNGDLTIGTTDTGFRFLDGSEQIIPWDVNGDTNKDGVLDLGNSTNRFDNLYLSGGVYLGGTGSANKLDDYEEGTFTPVVGSFGGGSTSIGTFHGSYTKIGNSVTILFHAINFTYSGGVGNLEITGLPFTPAVSSSRPTRGGNVVFYRYNLPNTGYGYVVPEVDGSGTMIFRVTIDDGVWAAVACENSSGLYVEGAMTYFTNS